MGIMKYTGPGNCIKITNILLYDVEKELTIKIRDNIENHQ